MSEDRSVLDVVENIDRKLDAKTREDQKRFEADDARHQEHAQLHRQHADRLDRHDEKFTEHDTKFTEHEEQLRSQSTMLRDQAIAITTVAGAAARATDHALDAKRVASQSNDEATKIVESAIRMHSASIASTVQQAVKAEVAPIVSDVGKLKTDTAAQDVTLAKQDDKLDTLLTIAKATSSALGSKRLRYFLLVCAALGAIAGGAAAGWNAHAASKIAIPSLTP